MVDHLYLLLELDAREHLPHSILSLHVHNGIFRALGYFFGSGSMNASNALLAVCLLFLAVRGLYLYVNILRIFGSSYHFVLGELYRFSLLFVSA